MATKKRDPLLTAARLMLTLCMGLAAIVGGAMIVLIPVILLQQGEVLTELAVKGTGEGVIAALCIVLALVAAMVFCAFDWLRQLRRIVDSVAAGDPFVPENATRLSRMGWLTVSVELLSIPIGGIGHWVTSVVRDATVDFGISVSGVLLAMVLFILARVFRRGAEMREELEGTV